MNLQNNKNEKLLVISPHPDDEVMGCYGLINTIKKNGGKVYVQILTVGGYDRLDSIKVTKEKWKKELEKVCRHLKIDGFDIMIYADEIKHLDEIPRASLLSYIESKSPISLFKIKPTIVAFPTIFSTHQDHTEAYKATIAALRSNPQKQFSLPSFAIS